MTEIIRKANLLSHSKWTITVKDREKEELPKRILPPLCVLDVLKRQGFWGSLLWVDWRLPRWYWQGGLYSKGDWPPVSRGRGFKGVYSMGSFMDLLFDAAGRLMSKERLRSGLRPAQCPVDQAEEKSWRKASRKSSIVWEKIRYKMVTKFISLASKAPTTAHHPTTRYNDVKNDAKKEESIYSQMYG